MEKFLHGNWHWHEDLMHTWREEGRDKMKVYLSPNPVVDDDGRVVCNVAPRTPEMEVDQEDREFDENLHLICAAPRLYRKCQEIVDWAKTHGEDHPVFSSVEKLLEETRDVSRRT